VNYLRAARDRDPPITPPHGDWRRATTRIFGSKPGRVTGAGLLPLLIRRRGNWRDDAGPLAGGSTLVLGAGTAYGRGLDGAPARPDMEDRVRPDLRPRRRTRTPAEHDIADSDDYFPVTTAGQW